MGQFLILVMGSAELTREYRAFYYYWVMQLFKFGFLTNAYIRAVATLTAILRPRVTFEG
jgi:hypothetical protein